MHRISDARGYDSGCETSGETGSVADAFTREDYYQKLVRQANTVPMAGVFKYYGVRVDIHNTNTTCPFKFHKGGRENSASFKYYPQTNSFYCYGCKTGGQYAHACEFMAAMENISKVDAAYKIFDLFKLKAGGELLDDENLISKEDLSEQLEILLDFSTVVREFRQNYPDESSFNFIEGISMVLDIQTSKRRLNNEALRRVVETMKNRIKNYIQCIKL